MRNFPTILIYSRNSDNCIYNIRVRVCFSWIVFPIESAVSTLEIGAHRTSSKRFTFPWLSYNDYSLTAPKRMPVVLVETINGTPERNNSNHFGTMEWCLTMALGEPGRIIDYNTCQVAKYDNYELGSFSEEAKHAWRDEHWEDDLQKAYDAGRRMAKL